MPLLCIVTGRKESSCPCPTHVDAKKERARIQMQNYRLKIKTEAHLDLETNGQCQTTGRCGCPQHKVLNGLVRDRTHKQEVRASAKADSEAHFEQYGPCQAHVDLNSEGLKEIKGMDLNFHFFCY